MNDKTYDIFWPTVHTSWNAESSKFKDELINYLVSLFSDTFNKRGVTAKAREYLKYVRDQYRVHIKRNPRYECPPIILERE